MITIFTLPKAFERHFGIIQRNAIMSWTKLRPGPEIILFGNEMGTAEIAQELALRHVPDVRCSEYGTPLLDDLLEKAQHLAAFNILCYVNADIILLSDFVKAVERVCRWRDRFLIYGRRSDVDLRALEDFDSPGCEMRLRRAALTSNAVAPSRACDYFVFPRGLYTAVPPLAVGRPAFDQWLVWKARESRVPVIDASAVILAIHQTHDYSHHPQGEQGARFGEEAMTNQELAAGKKLFLENATYRLNAEGINLNPGHLLSEYELIFPPWLDYLLEKTEAIRRPLGLRRDTLARAVNLSGGIRVTRK